MTPSRTWSIMPRLTEDRVPCRANRELPRWCGPLVAITLVLIMAMLSACSGSGASGGSQQSASLSGNWQFTVAPPADGSFLGGLQGGFLLQNGGSMTGAAAYAVLLPQFLIPCSRGSAAITGTVNGQNATFTATAGTQTFTFTGTLSLDGSTMVGTYASTAGTADDGSPCG